MKRNKYTRMRRYLAVMAAMFAMFAMFAAAASAGQPCPPKSTAPGSAATSTSTAVALQGQRQGQRQGQSQAAYGGSGTASATGRQSQTAQGGQGGAGGSASAAGGTATGGAASQSQDASNAGNAQSVAESVDYPRQTPEAVAGFVQPTIPCATARNAGASSPVVGLAFGFSGRDHDCDLRETARLFYEFGQPQLAVALLCQAARRFGLKNCEYVAPAADPRYVTREELRRAEKRIIDRAAIK